MTIRKRNDELRQKRASGICTNEGSTPAAARLAEGTVPEIYQVVIECRHEREQRAVFERMRGEGFRCRVLTL
jgi:hypothetical protein